MQRSAVWALGAGALLCAFVLSSIHPAAPAPVIRVEINAGWRLTARIVGPNARELMAPVDLSRRLDRLDAVADALRDAPVLPLEIAAHEDVIWRWVVRLLEHAERVGIPDATLVGAGGRRVRVPLPVVPWPQAFAETTFQVQISGMPGFATTVGFDHALSAEEREHGVSQRAGWIGRFERADPTSRPRTLDALDAELDRERVRAQSDGRSYRLGFVVAQGPVTINRPQRGVWFAPYRDAFDVLLAMRRARGDALVLVRH